MVKRLLISSLLAANTAFAGADLGGLATTTADSEGLFKAWANIDERLATNKKYGLNVYSQYEWVKDYDNSYTEVALYRDYKIWTLKAVYIHDAYLPNQYEAIRHNRYGVGFQLKLWE